MPAPCVSLLVIQDCPPCMLRLTALTAAGETALAIDRDTGVLDR